MIYICTIKQSVIINHLKRGGNSDNTATIKMKTLIKLVNGTEVSRKSGYKTFQDAQNAAWSWTGDCRIHKNERETFSFKIIDNEFLNENTSIAVIRTIIKEKGGVNSFSASIRRNRGNRPTRFNLLAELHDLSDYELNIAFVLGLIGNNGRKGSVVENCTRHGNICKI